MNSDNGGGKLVWINYFKEIQDFNNDVGEQSSKQYKGQWRASDMNIWEGFGVIKFADGSVYEG